MSELPAILRVFSYLSLLTVGGGMAAFPEMKTLTVDTHKWLNFDQMVHLYSIGQLSPGPNMMNSTATAMPMMPYQIARLALSCPDNPPSERMKSTLAAIDAAETNP